jgi:hypothetical protein
MQETFMTTRRTRRSQEEAPEEQNIELEQAVEVEKQEEIAPTPAPEPEPEPELSNDVVVARAVEKAKEIEERQIKKTGKIFLSDKDKKDFRKFNDYIMNKLGLGGTRSFKI